MGAEWESVVAVVWLIAVIGRGAVGMAFFLLSFGQAFVKEGYLHVWEEVQVDSEWV